MASGANKNWKKLLWNRRSKNIGDNEHILLTYYEIPKSAKKTGWLTVEKLL